MKTHHLPSRDFIVHHDDSLKKAIEAIERNRHGTIFVVSDEEKLLGALTDGDIRRHIITHGYDSDVAVGDLIVKECFWISEKTIIAPSLCEELVNLGVRAFPIVDLAQKIVEIVSCKGFIEKQNNAVMILMAGGRGTRLSPLTDNCPKALVKINGVPMSELIIRRAMKLGFSHFVMCVCHLKEQIMQHFGDGWHLGCNIDYVEEEREKPLGTAGALANLENNDFDHYLITNCDVIGDIDYGDILNFHIVNEADVTIVARAIRTQLAYGVIQMKSGLFDRIEEKPFSTTLVNAGVYVFNRDILSRVESGKKIDMPDLINSISTVGKVCCYQLDGRWFDVGTSEQLFRVSGEEW